MFKLVNILSFILFGKLLLNNNYFFSCVFKFEEFFFIHLYFFYLLHRWTIFLKIKKYFQIIFLICVALQDVFLPLLFYSINLIYISIYIIICLNK